MALNDKSPKLNMNDNLLNIKLKNHQRALLYKTIDIDRKYNGTEFPYGLISDKPGSGKTYVVLALIFYLIKFFDSKGPNIIVVPHNIYKQWITSIQNIFTKQLKCKYLTEYKDISQLYENNKMLYNYDIILITSIHYNSFASTLNSLNMKVSRIFFDEADTMKDLLTCYIPTNMNWFISATINRVFNATTKKAIIGKYELCLTDLLNNNCYCDNDFIDSQIKLPKPIEEDLKCNNFYIDNILCNIVPSEYIKNINSHNYNEIRKECEISTIKNEIDILKGLYFFCIKSIESLNLSIKDCHLKMKNCNQTEKANYNSLLYGYEQKKNTYSSRLNNIKILCFNNEICIKCFEKCSKKFIEMNTFNDHEGSNSQLRIPDITSYISDCKHYICFNCMDEIEKIEKNKGTPSHLFDKITIKCNECNENHLKSSYKIKTTTFTNKNINSYRKEKFDKNYVMEELIKICDDKIIIYCENSNISYYVKKITDKLHIDFEELNGGNISKIDEILTHFKDNEKVKILIIDNATMTVGMNLEFVNNIIIYSKTNNNIKKQLIGRSNRYPRTEKLYIFNLLYNNEK